MTTRMPAIICLLWLMGLKAHASDYNEKLLYESPKVLSSEEEVESDWRRLYHREMLKSSTITVYDKFGPFSAVDRLRENELNRSTMIEDYNRQGKNAVEKFLVYGARETAEIYLPYRDSLGRLQDFFIDLIHGSLGNTVEQEVSSTSQVYTAAEGQLVQNDIRNGTYKFGIRIRTHPYVYFRAKFGSYENKPIIMFETRVQYLNGENIEELIFIPLPYEWYMRISASIIPTQINNRLNDNRWKASWVLNHQVGKFPWEGAISMGVALDSPNSLVSTTVRTSARVTWAMDF